MTTTPADHIGTAAARICASAARFIPFCLPAPEQVRAFALSVAGQRAAHRAALCRAELRAKAAELVASDRLAVCGRA